MEVYQLNIESKHRRFVSYPASLCDFSYVEGNRVNSNEVISNPQISLYCLDDSNKRAIFVELPDDINVIKAPFLYQTQYEHAQRLIAVHYNSFIDLASRLPEIQRPIFIHTTGRSGSTLLSNVLNDSKKVVSLSEPDVVTQFAYLRAADKPESELRVLADCAIRFLFKSHHFDDVQAHAVKLRNSSIRVADLFQTAFPQGISLFLYRDALGFIRSFYRIFNLHKLPEQSPVSDWISGFEDVFDADISHFSQYLNIKREKIFAVEQLCLWWIAVMEWYLDQAERGSPMLAIRFADLIQFPEQTVRQVFHYCGLSMSSVQTALKAFDRDSQAGTKAARENPQKGNQLELKEEQIQLVKDILQRHSTLNGSDFNAPGTLQVSESS